MNYQKLCDDVIDAHEELTELTEQIALVDKSNTAALELVKEYYKAINNLVKNLQKRIANKCKRPFKVKDTDDYGDDDESESHHDYGDDDESESHHIELENGKSITFESQLLKMGEKRK